MSSHLSTKALAGFEMLEGRRRRRAADHLAACGRCRTRLARLRATREMAAEVTAPDAPDVWAAISARLDAGPPVLLPVPPAGDPAASGRRAGRRLTVAAALALLALTAVGAAAVVLTPLGTLLRRVLPEEPQAVPAGVLPVGAVEVEVPRAGLTVELAEAVDGFRVRIVTWDEDRLALVPIDAAVGVGFRSAVARVTVTGGVRGGLELRVPARGGTVRLVARGLTLAVARDGTVHAAGRDAAPTLDLPLGTLVAAAVSR